jgi:rRNA maturation endonuclease Nob1
MINYLVADLAVDFVVLAAATIALLLYMRLVIHQALLVEGVEHEIGPDSQCPECRRIVPTMAFCPSCGASRAAASKQGRLKPTGQA